MREWIRRFSGTVFTFFTWRASPVRVEQGTFAFYTEPKRGTSDGLTHRWPSGADPRQVHLFFGSVQPERNRDRHENVEANGCNGDLLYTCDLLGVEPERITLIVTMIIVIIYNIIVIIFIVNLLASFSFPNLWIRIIQLIRSTDKCVLEGWTRWRDQQWSIFKQMLSGTSSSVSIFNRMKNISRVSHRDTSSYGSENNPWGYQHNYRRDSIKTLRVEDIPAEIWLTRPWEILAIHLIKNMFAYILFVFPKCKHFQRKEGTSNVIASNSVI